MSSTALSIMPFDGSTSLQRVKDQRDAIKKLIKEVLVQGIDRDFAIIPGTKKLTLLKPGAEKICSLFGIAVEPSVSTEKIGDDVSFRVIVRLSSGGVFMGEGVGEASTLESKFAWRAAVCDEEFDSLATEPHRRRIHWKMDGYGENKKPVSVKQVRENPHDKMNNMLKIAKKRALIDAVLTATAASDTFTQDLENLIDNNAGKSSAGVSGAQVEAALDPVISTEDSKKFYGMWKNKGKHTKEKVMEYLKMHCGGITDDRKMPQRCFKDAMTWAATEGAPIPPVKKPEPKPAPTTAPAQTSSEPDDPELKACMEFFGFLGTDLAEQAGLLQEYRGRLGELKVELKSRLDQQVGE